MKNKIKIAATYVPHMDKYIANVSMNNKDYNLTSNNGADLPQKVKELAGVEIEYNFNERTFTIPGENAF